MKRFIRAWLTGLLMIAVAGVLSFAFVFAVMYTM